MSQETTAKMDAYAKFKRKIEIESLWLYIARILREGPRSVSEIRRSLKADFGIPVSTITLYTVLYRMEREGLVRRTEDFPIRFELTPYGSLLFRKSLSLLEEKLYLLKDGGE